MEPAAVRRTGELNTQSLIDALHDETVERGGDPRVVAVGTPALREQALEILSPFFGLERLVAGMPRVELDEGLGEAWELRPLSEDAPAGPSA